jgi:hypothetical protein
MRACQRTKRDGEPCKVSVPHGERYCYNHNPDFAEERKRSASRAATAKHSSIGKELRETRELILELLGVLLADQLPVRVRKELQNVVQLLQCYLRAHASCEPPRTVWLPARLLRVSRRYTPAPPGY